MGQRHISEEIEKIIVDTLEEVREQINSNASFLTHRQIDKIAKETQRKVSKKIMDMLYEWKKGAVKELEAREDRSFYEIEEEVLDRENSNEFDVGFINGLHSVWQAFELGV